MIKNVVKKITEKIKNMSMNTKRVSALVVCILLLVVAIILNTNLDSGEAGSIQQSGDKIEVGVKDEIINQSSQGIEDEGKGVIKVENVEEYFATLRLNKLNERSVLEENFSEIIESDEYDESYIADVVSKIDAMEETDAMENLAENLIAARGYSDVFVKIDDDFVYITVLAESLNENEASAIATTISEETGILIEDIILKGVY